jgi:hypothetical protein
MEKAGLAPALLFSNAIVPLFARSRFRANA